mgnify:CR=1 FL=1
MMRRGGEPVLLLRSLLNRLETVLRSGRASRRALRWLNRFHHCSRYALRCDGAFGRRTPKPPLVAGGWTPGPGGAYGGAIAAQCAVRARLFVFGFFDVRVPVICPIWPEHAAK